MAIIPILLDSRPPYLGSGSLLLLPAGEAPLLCELAAATREVTAQAPLVLPLFDADERYEEALRAEFPSLGGLLGPELFVDPLARFEPSDLLVLIAADCYSVDGPDLRRLVEARVDDARLVRHLLAFEATSLGTKELVESGADGRMRRIQRYYEPVTWPFPAGVLATLAPVACLLEGPSTMPASLMALRAALAQGGVPSQDVPYHGPLFDLTDEAGALALAERRLRELLRRRAAGKGRAAWAEYAETPIVGARAVVHETARLAGPVLVGESAVIEAGALIIGPAVIGPGARVSRDATVAQCLVAAGAVVPARATLRHRVVAPLGRELADLGAPPQRRHVGAGAPTPTAVPVVLGARGRGEAGGAGYQRLKRCVDVLAALTALLVLSPLFAVVALLVAATSRGPVFYGDPREGKDGRVFRCLKFRSMRANAAAMQRALARQQQMDGPQFKMLQDPRVTRVGWWLRRCNLDELPQLVNVLRGEMSLVGPRPSPFRENQICVTWRQARLSVRPGITGLWQLCRHDRAAGDFHQWIHYDLLYVRHASVRVDLKILAHTVLSLGGKRVVPLEAILGDAADAGGAMALDVDGVDGVNADVASPDPSGERAWV